MRAGRPVLIAVVLAFAAFAAPIAATPAPARDCTALEEGQRALAADDLGAAVAAYVRARRTRACAGDDLETLGQAIAERKYAAAMTHTPPDEAALLELLTYGRPWQALDALGDLAMARRDYKLAAERYQEALAVIADPLRTPNAPPAEVILGLKQKAEQAGLLSPEYVPAPQAEDGATRGLGAREIRGVAIGVVAFPVQFEFDSTRFTRSGAEAAADMARILRDEASPVVLIGHTDPRGAAAYNMDLSRRRAEALAAFLHEEGVRAPITMIGKGESEPYRPDDPSRYTQEELYQMDRRVELRRD